MSVLIAVARLVTAGLAELRRGVAVWRRLQKGRRLMMSEKPVAEPPYLRLVDQSQQGY